MMETREGWWGGTGYSYMMETGKGGGEGQGIVIII